MQLRIFKYQSEEERMLNDITTLEIEGEIWFVAKDVCDALEIKNARDAISSLDEDEKQTSVIPTSGQNRTVNIINESGLYTLIFKSRKDSAKLFRKWVTKEVIPSIRKKGYYGRIDRTQVPNFYLRYKDNLQKIPRAYCRNDYFCKILILKHLIKSNFILLKHCLKIVIFILFR
jgi:prophage antirepressor-like protein